MRLLKLLVAGLASASAILAQQTIGVTSSRGNGGSGTYSNGNSVALAQVGVARFNAPDSLKAVSGGNFAQTAESGGPLAGLAGTTIIGGNVEQSNTDTAGEFSKLIVTQQAYSANTRVITTSNQMIQDLMNMLR